MAHEQPMAMRTDYSVSIAQVDRIKRRIQETEPNKVGSAVSIDGTCTILVEFTKYESFLSEHVLYCYLLARKKIGLNISFPRHRQLATFKPQALLSHNETFTLAAAVSYLAEQFPEAKFYLLPKDFKRPPDFVSEGFYFSLSPSFLTSDCINRQHIISNGNHFYYMRPTINYTCSQVPLPGCTFDPKTFPEVNGKPYVLFEYQGTGKLDMKIDSGPVSYFEKSNKLVKKFFKGRARVQEFWQDLGSNHQFKYHPELNENQRKRKGILDPPPTPITELPNDNIMKRIQAPQDKYQMLDPRFNFGIGHWQLGSEPGLSHPERIESEQRIQLQMQELEQKYQQEQEQQEAQLAQKRKLEEIAYQNAEMEQRLKAKKDYPSLNLDAPNPFAQ